MSVVLLHCWDYRAPLAATYKVSREVIAMDLKSALNRVMVQLSACTKSPSSPMLQVGDEDRTAGARKPLDTRAAERSAIEALLQQASRRRQRFAPELRDLDLNPVRYLLRRQYHWPLTRILLAEDEFLEFLAAIRCSPEQPRVPTAAADFFWHSLLLIGPLYVSVCDRVFGGKLLLHDPFHGFTPGSGGSAGISRISRECRSGPQPPVV
jgi:hypothetical protein